MELRLWPTETGPTSYAPASAQATLSTEFQVTAGTWWLKELRVWRGNYGITGPIHARVYLVTSPTTGVIVPGTDLTITPRGLGWQSLLLPTPVLLTTGATYRACYWTPNGAASTANYW